MIFPVTVNANTTYVILLICVTKQKLHNLLVRSTKQNILNFASHCHWKHNT